MSGEFDLIATHFAPLATAPGSFGLKNDAAIFAAEGSVVATADAMVQGVHFLPGDPPGLVARKLLRVNLSDIAAMGGRPFGYLLTIALPRDLGEAWVAGFAAGLAEDQAAFGVTLLGGDTVSTPGPPSLSLTALGRVAPDRVLSRGGARAGDGVYVTGSIGDSALGLRVLQGGLEGLDEAARAALAGRYRLPEPRLELGLRLAEGGIASAAIDVSDGLVADLGHIAEESGLGAELRSADLPLSGPARQALEGEPALLEALLTGGDDYELLFCAGPGQERAVAELAAELGLPVTRIGRMAADSGVRVLAPDGAPLALKKPGWNHFA